MDKGKQNISGGDYKDFTPEFIEKMFSNKPIIGEPITLAKNCEILGNYN
ncbi:MAG: hypothetical protein KDC90_13340 [Ignavibacteriae bacterium]|nr:hypothetical protein [Ignavibacteriota bacterium]